MTSATKGRWDVVEHRGAGAEQGPRPTGGSDQVASAAATERHVPLERRMPDKGPELVAEPLVVMEAMSAARVAHLEEDRAEPVVGSAKEQPGPQPGTETGRISKAGVRRVGEVSVKIVRTGDRNP